MIGPTPQLLRRQPGHLHVAPFAGDLGWIGADKPMLDKGLSWVGGRSYFRDREVLHFEMPTEPTQRFGPMVNIQQYYAEGFAHDAAIATGPCRCALVNARQQRYASSQRKRPSDGTSANGSTHRIEADWVIACDGGRSTVRELLGLQLSGMQMYDGRYVIVDIEQATSAPGGATGVVRSAVEPGSTILMHRQPWTTCMHRLPDPRRRRPAGR